MSLQKLIEKMRAKALKQKTVNHEVFQKHSDDILKLCEAAEILMTSMENAKKDLDDLDTSLMVDYKIVMSGCSRAKLAITISQNKVDLICKE